MAKVTYLDNNATTRLDPRVLDAMLPLYQEQWANPGSGHRLGREVRQSLTTARRLCADLLQIAPDELTFTGGGTEADNLAIRGSVLAAQPPRHVITTAVEHSAVLDTCRGLEQEGLCTLTVLDVDGEGQIDMAQLERALIPGETCLVSAMWANNETGVLLPIEEIGRLAHDAGARLHVDGVQAIGKLDVRLDRLTADLFSVSAHKFHGPKGVGALVVRKGTPLAPQVTGGGQERGLRSGTENPAGIVGLARALDLAFEERPRASDHMKTLRDRLERGLLQEVEGLRITGANTPRLPNTTHLTLEGVESEVVLVALDRQGIACSAGSACSTGALEPSHVLVAMGIPPERIRGGVRLASSRETTAADIDHVVQQLPDIVHRLRGLASQ